MALVSGELKVGFLTDATGAVVAHWNAVVLPVPKPWVGDPDIPWGRVYLHLAADFGSTLVRVAVWGSNGWRVGVYDIRDTDGQFRMDFWEGDEKVSIGRVGRNPQDEADDFPVGYAISAVVR